MCLLQTVMCVRMRSSTWMACVSSSITALKAPTSSGIQWSVWPQHWPDMGLVDCIITCCLIKLYVSTDRFEWHHCVTSNVACVHCHWYMNDSVFWLPQMTCFIMLALIPALCQTKGLFKSSDRRVFNTLVMSQTQSKHKI